MVKEITFAPSPNSEAQLKLFESAGKALEKRGVKVSMRPGCGYPGTKAVAVWGWRSGQRLRKQGHDVLVFERAYLGDRFSWTSIAWNGLNGRARFSLPKIITGERFEKNFDPLKPWKVGGEYILIMGQVPGDMSLQGQDMTPFYEDAAVKLCNIHGLPVYFRPHPHGKTNFKPHIKAITGDLDRVLEKAALVVTYNSNSGVDAVVSGIPAIAMDKGSMAYEVTSHDLSGKLAKPDRTAWANRLAHCQYTPDEIASGYFWERLNEIG